MAIVLMVLHLIKPFNVPGLRRRRDFWKIAIAMVVVIVVTAAIRQ
jgi:hypothetical protein